MDPIPSDHAEYLKRFGADLKSHGIEFAVGLSPYELYRAFDEAGKRSLEMKVREIAALGATHLALLFDDMRGDLPDLASLQIEIIRFVQDLRLFKTLSFCPTYYSYDSILDKVFGTRPAGYLEELGSGVDSSVHFFWTGEKVCSKEYSAAHLREVSLLMKRKPFLWDNYPVNDGNRMCNFLHLREFTGRPVEILDELSGHAINPMNEANLSWIPISHFVSNIFRCAC